MENYEKFLYTQNVQRNIPGYVRLIQALLYLSVVIFTVLGAMDGLPWLVPALGTLVGSWYFMGAARVTYIYKLEGPFLRVQRVSGLKSRPVKEDFCAFDLRNLRAMGPEGALALEQAEAQSLAAEPKRITYDISAHDPDIICSIMYLTGIELEKGRELKVYFQPSPEMRRCIRIIAPERVFDYEDE